MQQFFHCKSIKKIFLTALVVLIATAFCFSLVACGETANEGEKNITVTVGGNAFEMTTEAATLEDALLQLQSEAKISGLAIDQSGYITAVGGLDTSGANSFIALYHDIDDATLYFPGYDVTVGGVTYRSSAAGARTLPVKDGAKYLIQVSTY